MPGGVEGRVELLFPHPRVDLPTSTGLLVELVAFRRRGAGFLPQRLHLPVNACSRNASADAAEASARVCCGRSNTNCPEQHQLSERSNKN